MTTLDNLLRGICEHPADTDRRLVYADACEDAGDHDRATFIRVQCEQASLCCHQPGAIGGDWDERSYCNDSDCRHCALSRAAYRIEGNGRLVDPHAKHSKAFLSLPFDWSHETDWRTWRGFVVWVKCTMAQWVEHGPQIVQRHPVTQVAISDLPDRWTNGKPYISPADVPQGIWLALAAFSERARDAQGILYANQEAQRDALSTAAITWARSVAGLPPLEQQP